MCSSMDLPPGFRFRPKDSELFSHYLYNKIHGTLLHQWVVRDCDLYGQEVPWTTWEKYGGNCLTLKDDLYFFTKLIKKTRNSCKKFDRIVGVVGRKGTWSGEKLEVKIQVKRSVDNRTIQLQGLKKRFSYENPTIPEQNKSWIMHEYSFPEISNWVLCRLRKNHRAITMQEKKTKRRLVEVNTEDPCKKRKLRTHQIAASIVPEFNNDEFLSDCEHQERTNLVGETGTVSTMQQNAHIEDGCSNTFDEAQAPLIGTVYPEIDDLQCIEPDQQRMTEMEEADRLSSAPYIYMDDDYCITFDF